MKLRAVAVFAAVSIAVLALSAPASASMRAQTKQMECIAAKLSSGAGWIGQCVRVFRLRPHQTVKVVGDLSSADALGVVDLWRPASVVPVAKLVPSAGCSERVRRPKLRIAARLNRCKSTATVRNRGRRAVTISTFFFWPIESPPES